MIAAARVFDTSLTAMRRFHQLLSTFPSSSRSVSRHDFFDGARPIVFNMF